MSQRLEELWVNDCYIDKCDMFEECVILHTLSYENNQIKNYDELKKLAKLPKLTKLTLAGNPLYQDKDWDTVAAMVVKRVPNLQFLDLNEITDSIRSAAE